MIILCIETSTSCCSAAICKDGVAVASRENMNGANHASELPVFIEQLLAEASANQWQIDAVALSQGPGSYTGLRIGTSIAKGICYGIRGFLRRCSQQRALGLAPSLPPLRHRHLLHFPPSLHPGAQVPLCLQAPSGQRLPAW